MGQSGVGSAISTIRPAQLLLSTSLQIRHTIGNGLKIFTKKSKFVRLIWNQLRTTSFKNVKKSSKFLHYLVQYGSPAILSAVEQPPDKPSQRLRSTAAG